MKYRSTKEEKFDSIYRKYADDIYRVCLYLTKDESVAQDIMLKTFVEFYDCFESVPPDCMFAYLVHITKRLTDTHQRHSEKGCEVKLYE